MSEDTRNRLIKLIVRERIENPSKKLLIADICKRASITRQSFHRYHNDLKPYIKGERAISELLAEIDEQSDNEILNDFYRKSVELDREISRIKDSHRREIKALENRLTTSLMNDDISLFNSEELRIRLDKQSLHNNKLVQRIKNLEMELAVTKSHVQTVPHKNPLTEFTVISEDLNPIFKNYAAKKDIELFESENDAAIEQIIKSTNKLCSYNTVVVVFVDRYLCSFEKFVDNYIFSSQSPHLFVRLPVHTRTELRIALKKFNTKAVLKLYMPYADSETTQKAQRRFYYNEVPSIELEAADKAYLPTISDQFSLQSISSFKVNSSD